MNFQPAKIIFFGLDSLFSDVLLRAMCHADLKPSLVVVGTETDSSKRAAFNCFLPVAPNLRQRIISSLLDSRHKYFETSVGQEHIRLYETAHDFGIDALITSDTHSVRTRARLYEQEADIFVVAGFHQLLSNEVLGLAKYDGINVHPGRLPEQRGPAPLFWTLKQGNSEVHFSIHILNSGEDAGDILSSGRTEYPAGEPGRDILKRIGQMAAPHLIRAIRGVISGDIVRTAQNVSLAARCPRPKYRDFLIDVAKSAEEVFRFVGGCAGAYPIFAECGGDRFFVAEAISFNMDERLPCEFYLSGDRLMLQCEPGIIELGLRTDGGAIFSAEYIERKKES
ncbi:MAG: formyltransferase family protein [Myxococcota bacterium]|nr:formyltransferase family protein [Myxococcota bacterium]